MDKPLQLIIPSDDGHKFKINEEAKLCLQNIDKPMSVVAIVGKYRTGKSYLMNRLYGKNSGFDLGGPVQSKTKGIWIWARPHPKDSNRYLLLIDTEGLYDVKTGDSTYDIQLFTLAVLLCNCLVYNSQGTIDADAINKLRLVSELTEHIKVQAGGAEEETGESFSKFFPQFFWVVRDFTLELNIEGKPCTPDEYLEHALIMKKGYGKAVQEYNAPRECIRAFFPQRKCFVLIKPVDDNKLLRTIDQAREKDIKPEFLEDAKRFCEAVCTGVEEFRVQGNTINGSRYLTLAETYVQAINSGAVPCIGTAVETMMQVECQRALDESVRSYSTMMEKEALPNMPLSLKELSSLHEQANGAALRVYNRIAVFDAEGIFQTKLQNNSVMDKPLQLIIPSDDGHKFKINEEAKLCLQKIDQPMSVVAIVGKYRTGKSYLMNRLYGKNSGFDLGGTVQSKTKGIWIWARPHPKDSNRYLLLIDTEGLYDVENGDSTYDTQLFTLAVLLSNCLVYNSQGTIDADAINKLHLVLELTEHIKVQAGGAEEETGESFSKFFPQFFWVVRDFTLELTIEGKPCTPDEYLDHALIMKKGYGKAVQEYNAPRQCIRAFFPQRKCFVLIKPVDDDKLLRTIDQAREKDIKPEFLEDAKRFCEAVWTGVEVFRVQGNTINGSRYLTLAETYVQAINSRAVPCIGTAVETIKQSECQRGLEESVKHNINTMEEEALPNMPLSLEELSNIHEQAYGPALRVYNRIAVFDAEEIFQTKLQEQLLSIYDDYAAKNKEASRKKCKAILQNEYADIARNIRAGHYRVAGGYGKYQADYQKVKEIYANTQRKGPCADEEMERFNEAKKSEGEAIMNADMAMSRKEKERAEARERQQQEFLRKKLEIEQQLQRQQELDDKGKSNLALMQNINVQFDEKFRDVQDRYEEDIRAKEKEYKRLLQEGLHAQAEEHKKMLDEMREKMRESEEQYKELVAKMKEEMLRQEERNKEIRENPPESEGGFWRCAGEFAGGFVSGLFGGIGGVITNVLSR